MDKKVKNIIENNIDVIETNQWDILSKRLPPNDFALIMPILLEAGIVPFPDIEQLERPIELFQYLSGVDGKVYNTPGYYAKWLLDGMGTNESIQLIAKIGQLLGFKIYDAKYGWYWNEDYLILHPDCNIGKFIEWCNSEVTEEEEKLSMDDFKETTLE